MSMCMKSDIELVRITEAAYKLGVPTSAAKGHPKTHSKLWYDWLNACRHFSILKMFAYSTRRWYDESVN